MGGDISDGPLGPGHLSAVFGDLRSEPMTRTRVRPNPRHGAIWAQACPEGVLRIPRLAHTIDLRVGFDELWANGFNKTTRKSVRRAERAGVEVEVDSTDRLIPVFYDLFLRSVGRWATMQNEPLWMANWRARRRDPVAKFETIAERLDGRCTFWVAWHEGRAVAASMVLTDGNVNDARAVMDKSLSAPVKAADLILKSTIEAACAAGCSYYHLGESGTSTGLARYKTRFGARPHVYEEYVVERLPVARLDRAARQVVKTAIGFEDLT
jgi:lipid II:glycine glycyltransferase (peptidoglycan interpeptide bridge formation enzyme)